MPGAQQKGAGRERDLVAPRVHGRSWNCWLSTHNPSPFLLVHPSPLQGVAGETSLVFWAAPIWGLESRKQKQGERLGFRETERGGTDGEV